MDAPRPKRTYRRWAPLKVKPEKVVPPPRVIPPLKRGQRSPGLLDPRRAAFLIEFVKHGNGKRAALDAGYSSQSSGTYGTSLAKDPRLAAAVEEVRERVMAKAEYTCEVAMKEAQAALDFAEETGNANAYVKAVELRSKLMGLLVEKIDLRQAIGFQIRIGGLKSSTAPPVDVQMIPSDTSVAESDAKVAEAIEDDPWS